MAGRCCRCHTVLGGYYVGMGTCNGSLQDRDLANKDLAAVDCKGGHHAPCIRDVALQVTCLVIERPVRSGVEFRVQGSGKEREKIQRKV